MKRVFLSLTIAALVSGCAGRSANPVAIQQPGDIEKGCAVLENDLAFIESEVARLLPETDKRSRNAALGSAGAVLFVPLLFMDFSDAEQVEINAYKQRYNHLVAIAMDKGCETNRTLIVQESEKK